MPRLTRALTKGGCNSRACSYMPTDSFHCSRFRNRFLRREERRGKGDGEKRAREGTEEDEGCLLYTSDAADDM
eukprot:3679992-Rhodomonas_salina.2